MRRRAVSALGLDDVPRDARGYVLDVQDNVLAGVPFGVIRPSLEAGAGKELAANPDGSVGKMHAPWSSAMLAVNAFGPWLADLARLRLAGRAGFDSMAFERRCSAGVRGTAPHLDVLLTGRDGVVGVESKLLEPLTKKTPTFSDAYGGIADERRNGRWFALLDRDLSGYRFLDVAQLIKHALGLARMAAPARPALLQYVWWEPTNAASFAVYRQHREELATFGRLVEGDVQVGFEACTHADLWTGWLADDPPDWMPAHVARLRARYERTLRTASDPTRPPGPPTLHERGAP